MADNYEFISAADLPTTDAKEVDVLCVENGELKRKAGASIGGGGGGYVINVPMDADINVDDGSAVLEESYDNFIDILYNGGSVWVDFTEFYAAMMGGIADGLVMRAPVSMWMFMEGILILMIVVDGGGMQITFPNGTWRPPTATEQE